MCGSDNDSVFDASVRNAERISELKKENEQLREWNKNILDALKLCPEFENHHWGGDKDGWGFCFELIKWLILRSAKLERVEKAAQDVTVVWRDMNCPLTASERDRADMSLFSAVDKLSAALME